jgi:hypothetical protein
MAAGCAGTALYHLAALLIPAFAKIAYPLTYPLLQHVTFMIVDGLAALLFLLRPRWFIWPYLALTVQVLQGHGVRGCRTWVQKHQLDWIDGITVFGVFIGLALLVPDRRLAQKTARIRGPSEVGPNRLRLLFQVALARLGRRVLSGCTSEHWM